MISSTLRTAAAGSAGTQENQAELYLERLAHHFSGEEVHFCDATQIRAFCERLRRSVSLLVSELQDLLAGRKKIQNDWTLYTSTALDSDQALMTRDIRMGDIHGDLGKMLFAWRESEAADTAAAGLRRALDELKHHQMATMAGYERSVSDGARSLLDRLDPGSVEREFVESGGPASAKGFKFRRFLPLRGYFLWRAYQKRFDQLRSEDARWYQSQFLPAFRQGYRDYMVTRMKAASKQALEN